ncbi:ankyrin repeat and LEM domain-containing protein 1-like isoform X2 [Zophobas morio]|uniref:ankyrin repeat and LEM domain-containing protein 1-like isoform X2 n=1 Tax=Zophobas morio TaxID=2755281 RepID=UPI0030838750
MFCSVKTLLSKGADPNLILPKRKISSFHLIIGNDSEKFALNVTTLILQHGGNPNVQSDDGLTPIHIAAAWGRYDLLKLLLDCGGSPEIRDINKKTALHYAVEEKYMDCYNLLKLYVTDKASIMCREKEDCINYAIKLDKILVNNGTTLGEYEIVNEYKTDSIFKDTQQLQDLPETDSKEYVMSWFNSLDQSAPKMSNKLHSNGSTSGISDDSGDSLKESDEERYNPVDVKNICFRKVYRKKVKTPKSSPIKTSNQKIKSKMDEIIQFSNESGIAMLPDSLNIKEETPLKKLSLDLSKGGRDTSSDYVTCTSGISPDILERNIFDFTNLMTSDDSNKSQLSTITKSEGISSSDLSFISVTEIYKYVDKEEGIVLYERRFLKTPISDGSGSVKSFVSSKLPLPETIEYEDLDNETLRKELALRGYNPGPITSTTRRVYLQKLKQLKKLPLPVKNTEGDVAVTRAYSKELEWTLKNPDWLKDISVYKTLDEAVLREFATPDPSRKWREGNNKSSFTYLLLDPRLTNNLPVRAESLKPKEIWETFLSAVFYVGKGKRSRPYDHIYDAVNLWNQGIRTSDCKKQAKILDIWSDNSGVVCLHLFQNTIPVESYTREAAIIDAFKVENLCNAKGGNFYGLAATWPQEKKTMLGVYLLYKAMMIFLNEGERQLCPSDIN